MCGSWSIKWCISRWFNWTIANSPPFVLDIDVSTEMGLVVVADLDLTQFSIIPELWYDVKIEVLEVLIQFSIIILQCHIYNSKAQLIIYRPFHLSVFERESDAITLFHKYILIRDNVFLSKCILDGREDLVSFFKISWNFDTIILFSGRYGYLLCQGRPWVLAPAQSGCTCCGTEACCWPQGGGVPLNIWRSKWGISEYIQLFKF